MVSTVQTFMVLAAKALEFTPPKCGRVATMRNAVVHHFGDGDASFGFAKLTQWMRHEMVAAAASPPVEIIGAASGIAALSAALGVKLRMLAPTVLRHGAGCCRQRRVGARQTNARACALLDCD